MDRENEERRLLIQMGPSPSQYERHGTSNGPLGLAGDAKVEIAGRYLTWFDREYKEIYRMKLQYLYKDVGDNVYFMYLPMPAAEADMSQFLAEVLDNEYRRLELLDSPLTDTCWMRVSKTLLAHWDGGDEGGEDGDESGDGWGKPVQMKVVDGHLEFREFPVADGSG